MDINQDASQQAPSANQVVTGEPAVTDPLIGHELAGRYQITEMLGAGAMGVVYKARHKLLNREVAVKVLKGDVSRDETTRRRFDTEAKAASSLTHPNLIAVHDYGFLENDTPYLIMDYLQGESLADVLKNERRLPPARVIAIAKQMCAGLAHAHYKGLVHRDLKPNNIILVKETDGTETVKIVDFGIVKPISSDEELTEAGQIFGTPSYMSPEQCQGHKLDGRSDIYALGCLMYRMLVGRPPYVGDNPVVTIVMHVKNPIPDVPDNAITDEISKQLVPVIACAMAKDAARRFQSADALRAELERIEQGQSASHPATMPGAVSSVSLSSFHRVLNPRLIVAATIACFVLAVPVIGIVGSSLIRQMSAEDRAAQAASDAKKEQQLQQELQAEEQTRTAADERAQTATQEGGIDAESAGASQPAAGAGGTASSHHLHQPRVARARAHVLARRRTLWQKFVGFFH